MDNKEGSMHLVDGIGFSCLQVAEWRNYQSLVATKNHVSFPHTKRDSTGPCDL